MKALRTSALSLILLLIGATGYAQQDVGQRALRYADSLLTVFRNNDLNTYIDLSYPGVVRYYGGRHQFREYLSRERELAVTAEEEKTELVQMERSGNEWQAVVRRTILTAIDQKKATVVSYLVGQSTDDGRTWKYFDMSLNPVGSLVYIMPDVFENLAVPQRQVIFAKTQLARQ